VTEARPEDRFDRLKAIHEAGHAIASDELEVGWSLINIEGDGELAGWVGVEGDDGFRDGPDEQENDQQYRLWAMEHATIDYAGQAAVVVALGGADMTWKSAAANGAGPDFEKAKARLTADQDPQAAKACAVEIVTRRMADLEKIADAVQERRRLRIDEFDALVRPQNAKNLDLRGRIPPP
jgi:hypothetical protein